jgi:hypothetical protein
MNSRERTTEGNLHGGKFPSRDERGIAPSEFIDSAGVGNRSASPLEEGRSAGEFSRSVQRRGGGLGVFVYGAIAGVIAAGIATFLMCGRGNAPRRSPYDR